MFLSDDDLKVEEVNVVAMNEMSNQYLEVIAINLESGQKVELVDNKYHLNRRYDIHPTMYPKLKMCFRNSREDKNDVKIKVFSSSHNTYTNKKDIIRSQKMLELLKKETSEFVAKIDKEDKRVSEQMASLSKSSWYLYLAIAAKIYVIFVLAIFQGGLFVRHVSEMNKNEVI